MSPAGPGGKLRRLNGRRRQFSYHLRLSEKEQDWLVPRAAVLGLSLQRFLVESAMAGSHDRMLAQRAVFAELLAARRDLRGAVVNLNQLARLGNETGGMPTGLRELAARLDAAQERLAVLAPGAVEEVSRVP